MNHFTKLILVNLVNIIQRKVEVTLCDPFIEQSFFRGAPQFFNRVFYSVIEGKGSNDQITRAFFYIQGVIIVKMSTPLLSILKEFKNKFKD